MCALLHFNHAVVMVMVIRLSRLDRRPGWLSSGVDFGDWCVYQGGKCGWNSWGGNRWYVTACMVLVQRVFLDRGWRFHRSGMLLIWKVDSTTWDGDEDGEVMPRRLGAIPCPTG